MIRPASVGDAPVLAEMWNWMIRDTLATFSSDEKTTNQIKDLIRERAGCFIVHDAGKGVQGFATFGAFRSGPGYALTCEHSIIVTPAAQGQKIGRALMTHLQAAARAQGVRIMIAAISGANEPAVAFHTVFGFAKVGHLPQVGYKNGQFLDLILMQKNLTESG